MPPADLAVKDVIHTGGVYGHRNFPKPRISKHNNNVKIGWAEPCDVIPKRESNEIESAEILRV